MTSYKIKVLPAAERQLRKLPKNIQKLLIRTMKNLGYDPRPHGIKILSGTKETFYRLRVKNYRIIYHIVDCELLILIVKIGTRQEVYKQISKYLHHIHREKNF